MKTLTRLLLLGLMCLSVARADVPALIANGFDAYKAGGSKGALAIWLKGVQSTANINTSGLPPDIGPGYEAPGAYGPMESYEVMAMYGPTARLRRIYAVAYFPQGPLFCCFDLYRVSGAWTVYDLKFSTTPDQVVPVELIEKTG
jgi:hypothetical protein